jgi:hypothetical protein
MARTGTSKTHTRQVQGIDFQQLRHVRHGHDTLYKRVRATETISVKLLSGYRRTQSEKDRHKIKVGNVKTREKLRARNI